jgi:hypothetical protein
LKFYNDVPDDNLRIIFRIYLIHFLYLAISLKDKMLESLDHTTLDLVLPDRAEYNTITFQALYNRVKTLYQNITPAHLLSIETDIKSPLIFSHPNAYEDHIAKHVHLNRGLVAAARTRSEIDKISDLRTSLLTSPHAATFSTFLDYYDATHRTLASQSFTDMHEACSAAIPTLLVILWFAMYSRRATNEDMTIPTNADIGIAARLP